MLSWNREVVTRNADYGSDIGQLSFVSGSCSCTLLSCVAGASRIAAMVVLLTCLICPIVEMFDSWDDTIQTGNETEYTLVILALCVGVAYSFVSVISKSRLFDIVSKNIFAFAAQNSSLSAPCGSACSFLMRRVPLPSPCVSRNLRYPPPRGFPWNRKLCNCIK
jgi:hypothetical protein